MKYSFDTSDTYGDGRSEKFLSEILKETKDILQFTKLACIRGTNYPRGAVNMSQWRKFIDRSLKNLE